jgi:hypothetical protein
MRLSAKEGRTVLKRQRIGEDMHCLLKELEDSYSNEPVLCWHGCCRQALPPGRRALQVKEGEELSASSSEEQPKDAAVSLL